MLIKDCDEWNGEKVCFEVDARDLGKVLMAIGDKCNKLMSVIDLTPCKHYTESRFEVQYLDRDGMRTHKCIESNLNDDVTTAQVRGRG